MLNLADLLNLIRLTELELRELRQDIDGDDEPKRDEAGEVIIQFDDLSLKLKKMYQDMRKDDSDYPLYEDYINLISK